MSVTVVVTFVPKTHTSNVEWGLLHRVWGLPEKYGQVIEADFDWLINCSEVNGLPYGPRATLDLWREKGLVTLNIARRASGVITDGLQPFWPDEVDAAQIRYTHRFAISSEAEIVQIRAGQLPEPLLEAVSKVHAKPRKLEVDDDDFLQLLQRGGWEASELPAVPLEHSSIPSVPGHDGRGQGYINDPQKRKAVELHAEDMAIHYLETVEGWTDVVRVGKPYDLRCSRDGAEKRVEVKGTTGTGASVFLTANEVDHARGNDSGQPIDLILVSGILVTRSDDSGYIASGGRLAQYRDYIPADEDLRPTQYEATLTAAPSSVVDVGSLQIESESVA